MMDYECKAAWVVYYKFRETPAKKRDYNFWNT
jgi:hypothetical protein